MKVTKGGVLLYISDELHFKPRNDLTIYSPKNVQSIFVEVINSKNTNTLISSIYRYPSMDAAKDPFRTN